MDWPTWSPRYKRIVDILNLDADQDNKIGLLYNNLLTKKKDQGFNDTIAKILRLQKQSAWVFGAGPSLPNDFHLFLNQFNADNDLVVCADGSSVFLVEENIFPDIVFTDFDGATKILNVLAENNTILVLHAHGDNFSVVKDILNNFNLLDYNILPTVQTKPYPPFTYNFGGFTDGDRAISALLDWFPSMEYIFLLGFTFGEYQGRYSKPETLTKDVKASNFKLAKLKIAKENLEFLATHYSTPIINLSQPTEVIKGIKNIKPRKT